MAETNITSQSQIESQIMQTWTGQGHVYWTLQTAETSHGEDQLIKYCLSLLHYGNQFDQHFNTAQDQERGKYIEIPCFIPCSRKIDRMPCLTLDYGLMRSKIITQKSSRLESGSDFYSFIPSTSLERNIMTIEAGFVKFERTHALNLLNMWIRMNKLSLSANSLHQQKASSMLEGDAC
uniref:Uncharacterized protein n=1 Tax=Salix viminalis TaxID=40686 RepID=A0A6N2NCC6_SALVM